MIITYDFTTNKQKELDDFQKDYSPDNEIISSESVNASYYGDYDSYISNENEYIKSEIALWRAVLLQKICDASSNSKKPEVLKIKREAINWLLEEKNEDLKEICETAIINFSKIQKLIKKKFGSNDFNA